MSNSNSNLIANWAAPINISALTTYRFSGVSKAPFDSNNLGFHTGDNVDDVKINRLALTRSLSLPSSPEWLNQTHSTECIIVEEEKLRNADAAITRSKNKVLAIMTADCLPILLCNQQGTEIAAIHAGWKGLVNGIIENTLIKMHSPPDKLLAWIGPAICQSCFEVGNEVRELFQANYSFGNNFFIQKSPDKWLGNLAGLAEKILNQNNVTDVFQSNACTFERKKEFYSYRREQQTGRIASLIWFNK